ncbi:hypothetical protein NPIL_3651 [Nephila pilipes]|uniref:Uncharacterized protein n=1 Tax=Nephila pilipes TaxID=299642 RepID=A0A8X6QUC9_NEPPI|nr:hypothetical protein NPIL_3651 [Nephila pilipes]
MSRREEEEGWILTLAKKPGGRGGKLHKETVSGGGVIDGATPLLLYSWNLLLLLTKKVRRRLQSTTMPKSKLADGDELGLDGPMAQAQTDSEITFRNEQCISQELVSTKLSKRNFMLTVHLCQEWNL